MSRFSIFEHILNAFSRNKRDLWHEATHLTPYYSVFSTKFDKAVEGKNLDEALGPPEKADELSWGRSQHRFFDSVGYIRKQQAPEIDEALSQIESTYSDGIDHERVISFLVDHSGSMRENNIQLAAIFLELLCPGLLERGIRVEVLGFTTVSWRGGQSREQWLQLEKPTPVGRLCDLLHVIHRSADDPDAWNTNCLLPMLRPDILKENIDGEALLWAEQRLRKFVNSSRMIIVLSDGAPVDDSTLSVNPGDYLEKHLLGEIERIKISGGINLVGIGIQYVCNRYYGEGAEIMGLADLVPALQKICMRIAKEFQHTSIDDTQSGDKP